MGDQSKKRRKAALGIPPQPKYITITDDTTFADLDEIKPDVSERADAILAKLDALHDGFDKIKKPEHYNVHPSGIEIIQITKYETFFRGNILKYVIRAPYKGSELEDLEKAREYLDREIEFVKEKQREAEWAKLGPAEPLFQ